MLYERFWKACEDGKTDDVLALIDKIDDIDKKNEKGWNAIIIASFNHRTKIIGILIENGANINSTNANGTSVFMYAKTKVLLNKNYAFLDYLIENSADINLVDTKNKWTVLDYCRHIGDKDLIDYLISKGAK